MTTYHIKNTTKFATDIKNLWVGQEEILNSIDMVSMFLDVSTPAAMDLIRERLVKDQTLNKQTNLQAKNVVDLLELIVMKTTSFQFSGVL